ncbi:MAG: P1 family peptidase, partial [Balneolaceae bacterium]|nr:P1 family peptidase [Balneolaceae bacterium]
ADALIDHAFSFGENSQVRSVNPVVGETNDGWLNDIRGRHVTREHVWEAIDSAAGGPVAEGNVGAGTGTQALGFKGGIGTSSRKLPDSRGGYTVGVLVQSNFGGELKVNGSPVGKTLGIHYLDQEMAPPDRGSCMIVVATDAPLTSRNLKRLAKRALLGMARTGGIMSNGSGDYVIAFSTAAAVRVAHQAEGLTREIEILRNGSMSPLFMAVIEATEEAILNSLFHAESMTGRDGHTVESLPVDKVLHIINN